MDEFCCLCGGDVVTVLRTCHAAGSGGVYRRDLATAERCSRVRLEMSIDAEL